MNDMTIELHLLVFLHLYMATIAAQVIAGQVDQHDMLCILLGIGAQTLGIPAAEIDTLELLAKNAEGFDGLIVPMLDARRGQVYAALFENGKRLCEDMAAPVEDIVSLVGCRRAGFLGDGAEAL